MVQSLVEETAKNGSNSQGEAKSHNYWHNFLQNQDIDPVLIEDLFTSLSADPNGPGLNWASMVLALQEQFSKRLTVTPEKNAVTWF